MDRQIDGKTHLIEKLHIFFFFFLHVGTRGIRKSSYRVLFLKQAYQPSVKGHLPLTSSFDAFRAFGAFGVWELLLVGSRVPQLLKTLNPKPLKP